MSTRKVYEIHCLVSEQQVSVNVFVCVHHIQEDNALNLTIHSCLIFSDHVCVHVDVSHECGHVACKCEQKGLGDPFLVSEQHVCVYVYAYMGMCVCEHV